MKVMLDPGHGGSDTGAVGGGTTEKVINLEVAEITRKLIQAQGLECEMTRYQDTDVSLDARCQQANLWQANIFISIHHNAANSRARGYEVYHHTGSVNGAKLANVVAKHFGETQTRRYVGGGTMAGWGSGEYYVLRNTAMPAILTEYCFMDNPDDFIKFDAFRQANDIAKSVCEYFGVDFKEPQDDATENKKLTEALEHLKGWNEPTDLEDIAIRFAEIHKKIIRIDRNIARELLR